MLLESALLKAVALLVVLYLCLLFGIHLSGLGTAPAMVGMHVLSDTHLEI